MILEQQTRLITPAAWNPANVATGNHATLLGSRQVQAIPRANPIQMIILLLSLTIDTTGLTVTTGSTGVVGCDNVANIIKNVRLEAVATDEYGWGAYTVVNYSGIGLMELMANAGLNLDTATLEFIKLWANGVGTTNIVASQKLRLAIPIPIPYHNAGEPLLTRMLLPCHDWEQDPVLTVDFETGPNMYSAGKIVGAKCDILVVYREMTADQTAYIKANGGFLKTDLLESGFNVPLNTSGNQRIPINPPGSYLNLLLRSYLGGTTTVRDIVDQDTTFGAESIYTLETNGNVKRQFRMKFIQTLNCYSKPQNVLSQTSSPNFAGTVGSGLSFQPAGSVLLDFVNDGLETANELGSVLDVNIPAKSGLKMELVVPCASVATNSSAIFYGGHRVYGDLRDFRSKIANIRYGIKP